MAPQSPILAAERRLHAAEHGSDELPAPTASATAHALSDALAAGELDDHVDALRTYAAEREGASLTEDGHLLTLTVSDGEVLVELGDERRIGRLAFTMTPVDLPHRGFWARLFRRG
ncbi:hypothetical protein [Salinibacterium sp. ZJ70]|uniref:hypothetical protein n=1 Tax=Salinibacterium sp. ZJ70 TaxID=2708084 RepID=UPI0014247076|nr:hypothetical protein [Salinibacterium sp. ZJ70]